MQNLPTEDSTEDEKLKVRIKNLKRSLEVNIKRMNRQQKIVKKLFANSPFPE